MLTLKIHQKECQTTQHKPPETPPFHEVIQKPFEGAKLVSQGPSEVTLLNCCRGCQDGLYLVPLFLAGSILCRSPVSKPTSCQIPSSLLLGLEIFWINPKNSWTGILSELSHSHSFLSSTQLNLKVVQSTKGWEQWTTSSHRPPPCLSTDQCSCPPIIQAPSCSFPKDSLQRPCSLNLSSTFQEGLTDGWYLATVPPVLTHHCLKAAVGLCGHQELNSSSSALTDDLRAHGHPANSSAKPVLH